MNYVVFGGSGFIGTHLMRSLVTGRVRPGDRVWCVDIVMPGEEGVVPGVVERVDGVDYVRCDVRRPIEVEGYEPSEGDVVFNLAAVHRTPGHADRVVQGSLGRIDKGRLKILSGPLIGREADIVRFNRRKRKAVIRMMVMGRAKEIELELEIVGKDSE